MATAEDSTRPTSVHDSSFTQPLLSSPPPSFEPDPEQESDQTQYLQITYNYNSRPFKDWPFLIVFSLLLLSTFGFGIFTIFHRNSNYSNVSSYTYSSTSASCVYNSSTSSSSSNSISPLQSFYLYPSTLLDSASSSSDLRDLIWVLVVTSISTIPISFLLLILLKHYAKQVVYASLPFFVLMPVFLNIYWFVACTISSSCSDAFPLAYRILALVFVFLAIGVIVWIIVANWHRIELTVNIIGVASDALSRNLGLFGVLPCMSIGLVVYYAPIVVFLVYAKQNGKIIAKESNGDYKCTWKQDSWVSAYFALAIITMLWSLTAMIEAQVYVISGTIAQWYFAKEDDSNPRRAIRSSLRNALGPSSGTVFLSGLLIGTVRLVRVVVDTASREDAPGVVNLALRCCVNVFFSSFDFLNKFTIIFASITGEAYCTSARSTYELLKRNLLSAVFVETISTRLLGGIIFVLSAVYAIAVWGILKGVTDLGVDSYLFAVLAWVLLIIVLGFFLHVLDNVVDTIYVCYAIDRDRGEVCKQDVHEVYVQLPISRNSRSPSASRTLGLGV